ncbi:MAG: ribonuclease HII [Patescibacteria group bacterium]
MRLPTKSLERNLFKKGVKKIIAVDEVGMGSLAGPVVVCAVQFSKKFFKKRHKNLHWLRDSKLLAPHQRENFVHELLKEKNFEYRIGYCYPKTIDRVNIYQAARLAMRRAVKRINKGREQKTFVLVDGPNEIKGLEFKQLPIIKGDRKVFSIACASLIAKVFRDKMMIKYAKRFSEYGFEKHKGYGTKFHRVMLVKHGRSPIHRISFRLI